MYRKATNQPLSLVTTLLILSRLAEVGCEILEVKVTNPGDSTFEEAKEKIGRADVIIVSGGNTLFAADRWKKLGVDVLLREAAERGAVNGGGEAERGAKDG